jgi:uncharacterized protein (TIGR02444 family)
MAGDAKGAAEAAGVAFWRFSLALYARPAAAAALLVLQDRAGRDVNLILFALWLGVAHGRRLDSAGLAAAEAALAPVADSLIAPLRELRRRLKPADDPLLQALRRRIAALELAAEQITQYRLAAHAADQPCDTSAGDRLAVAAANLDLYLGAEAASAEAAVLRAALAGLMRRSGELL